MNDINSSGSFRVKKNPFTQVSNSALRDSNLSLKAKGLYGLIQSYITIPDFILYKSHLMSICREKEKAFDSAWKELKVNGYLKQYRIPKGKNDSFVYEYDLLDVSDLTTPPLINLNKNGEEITSQKDRNSHTPHFGPYANSTICEAHPMPNGGGINNTDFNNTDLIYIESKSSQSQTEEKTDGTPTHDTDYIQQKYTEMKKESFPNATDQSNRLENPSTTIEDDYTIYEQIIKDNIEYEFFTINKKTYISMIDELIFCMLDVICTKEPTVKINGETKSRNLVKSVYLKLDSMDIEHVIDQYKDQYHKITHKPSYLKTMLYNVKQEHNAHYTNLVNQHMAQGKL